MSDHTGAVSRDTQADLDRIPEHFARLAEAQDRAEFSAYCKRVSLRIAPVANGWQHAFDAWRQARDSARSCGDGCNGCDDCTDYEGAGHEN